MKLTPLVLLIIVTACATKTHLESQPTPQPAQIAWTATGAFCEPETVLPLPDNTLLVSNVCGFRKLGNGFLSLLDADGTVIDWRVVAGLDAPLGMARVGDRLYVVDNNRVRTFRWPGFEPLATIDIDTAVANDIAVAPDGTLYVTDMARHQVIQRLPDGTQQVLTESAQFKSANGIALQGDQLFIGGERLWCVNLSVNAITTISPPWLTDIDGIEVEADGTVQITPVGGPLVRYFTNGRIQILAGDAISSANHGYAPALGLAIIPTGYNNSVIAIHVPPAGHVASKQSAAAPPIFAYPEC